MKYKIVYNPRYQCNHLLITGFSLEIGNNYTMDHFTEFLFEQNKVEIIELCESMDLDDIVTLQYQGSYGTHKDKFSISDLMDYFRPLNKIYYS